MDYKLEFFGPEKAVSIEVQLIKAFLHEAFTGCEVRWVSWERQKHKEWILGNASDSAKFFRECHRDRMDFLVHCLVFENKGGVGRQKWQEWMWRNNMFRWRWSGWRQVIDNRDDLNCGRMSSARVCQDVHPAGDISGIAYGNLYLAAWEIFKSTEKCLLEGTSKEEAKGGVFDDMRVDFEQDIAYL